MNVAVISVISSGIVGVLGAATGFFGQYVNLFNERSRHREARRSDLRSVFDDAAGVAIGWNPPAGRGNARITDTAAVLDRVATDMLLQRARLGVRLGVESPVYQAYHAFQYEIDQLAKAMRRAPSDMTVERLKGGTGIDEAVGPLLEEIVSRYESVTGAMHKFFTEAAICLNTNVPNGGYRAVGPR